MNLFKRKEKFKIVERSNVVQYDDMGYPLRLVIDNKGKQMWIDSYDQEGDVVLERTKGGGK